MSGEFLPPLRHEINDQHGKAYFRRRPCGATTDLHWYHFKLPPAHVEVLGQEPQYADLSPERALMQAIALYQSVQVKAREGLQLAFVDQEGNFAKDQPSGLPVFD